MSVTLLRTHQNGYNEENAGVGRGEGTGNAPARLARMWAGVVGVGGVGGPKDVQVGVPAAAARLSVAADGGLLRGTVGALAAARSRDGLWPSDDRGDHGYMQCYWRLSGANCWTESAK